MLIAAVVILTSSRSVPWDTWYCTVETDTSKFFDPKTKTCADGTSFLQYIISRDDNHIKEVQAVNSQAAFLYLIFQIVQFWPSLPGATKALPTLTLASPLLQSQVEQNAERVKVLYGIVKKWLSVMGKKEAAKEAMEGVRQHISVCSGAINRGCPAALDLAWRRGALNSEHFDHTVLHAVLAAMCPPHGSEQEALKLDQVTEILQAVVAEIGGFFTGVITKANTKNSGAILTSVLSLVAVKCLSSSKVLHSGYSHLKVLQIKPKLKNLLAMGIDFVKILGKQSWSRATSPSSSNTHEFVFQAFCRALRQQAMHLWSRRQVHLLERPNQALQKALSASAMITLQGCSP